ncbi:MAG: hypothetical protein QF464_06170, partial [Myxococcota bacterium]|nr:hypothetical protein [Myxococcota bacterium]
MRCVLLVLTASLALVSSCDESPKNPAPPPTQPPPVAAQPAPVPLPTAGRRERAGIDLAGGKAGLQDGKAPGAKARVPAAEFIALSPPAPVAEPNVGPRKAAVEGALTWLQDTWSPAALGDDTDTYAALLHADFRGRLVGRDGTIARDHWAKTRKPAIGTAARWGLPRVTANPNSTGRVTLEIREATGGTADCEVTTRTLTVQPA